MKERDRDLAICKVHPRDPFLLFGTLDRGGSNSRAAAYGLLPVRLSLCPFLALWCLLWVIRVSAPTLVLALNMSQASAGLMLAAAFCQVSAAFPWLRWSPESRVTVPHPHHCPAV